MDYHAANRPSGFATTPDGRLAGSERVYVVDASVFPSLPAQNPTLTAVANAARIASQLQ